jgi:FAD dependent oxidoreductase TIGR03364
MPSQHANVAIIGAGIVGLAHAYIAAKSGKSVAVFEKRPRSTGASARAFGLIAPISQAAGSPYQTAIASREEWMGLLQAARLPYQPTGSLHLAYHDDELAAVREFCELGPELGFHCRWLRANEVEARTQAVLSAGLLGALWSPTEVAVDPRLLLRKIPEFLAERYGVKFCFGCAVRSIDLPRVDTGAATGIGTAATTESWSADAAIVCAGEDFETLYPGIFAGSGLTRSKAQILRTAPQPGGWRLGPSLLAGLSLRHSPAFSICPSRGQLRERIARELPEYDRWGIHVMVAQGPDGELTLGSSHEDGLAPEPFDRTSIDNLIISYVRNFLQAPNLDVSEHWHAIQARHPEHPFLVCSPAHNVRVVTGLGEADLTLSFGLAKRVMSEIAI